MHLPRALEDYLKTILILQNRKGTVRSMDVAESLHLLARNNSPLLRSLLREALISRWFRKLGIDQQSLTAEKLLQIDYIASGFISVLGNPEIEKNPLFLQSFPDSLIGRAAIKTLQQMA